MLPRERYKIPVFDLRYKHVEFALAEVLKIPESRLSVFRARLRHLRNIGTLFSKPGKGSHASYTGDNALELLLTLQLNIIGYSPSSAAAYAAFTMERLPNNFLADPNLQDVFALVFTAEDTLYAHFGLVGMICYGEEQLHAAIRKGPPAFSLIKVSERARDLSEALTKAVRGGVAFLRPRGCKS